MVDVLKEKSVMLFALIGRPVRCSLRIRMLLSRELVIYTEMCPLGNERDIVAHRERRVNCRPQPLIFLGVPSHR